MRFVKSCLAAGVGAKEIGVLSFYQDQCKELFNRLGALDVKVGTVDSFQGQEKPLMILSCVSANPKRGCGFQDSKRINVALSRAQIGMVVVGHIDTLKTGETWSRVIKHYRSRGLIARADSSACTQSGVAADGSTTTSDCHADSRSRSRLSESVVAVCPAPKLLPDAKSFSEDGSAPHTVAGDAHAEANVDVQSLARMLIGFFNLPIVKAVGERLEQLSSFHTKRVDETSWTDTVEGWDVKAWSREGGCIRLWTSLDASNTVYSMCWTAASIFESSLPVVASLRRRFSKLRGGSEEDFGDIIEAFLGVLRPWPQRECLRDEFMQHEHSLEEYEAAADELERIIHTVSQCTSDDMAALHKHCQTFPPVSLHETFPYAPRAPEKLADELPHTAKRKVECSSQSRTKKSCLSPSRDEATEPSQCSRDVVKQTDCDVATPTDRVELEISGMHSDSF